MSEIIAITTEDDAHLPYVQQHIEDLIRVIDPTKIIDGEDISYDFQQGNLTVTHKGRPVGAGSVWYRKPTNFGYKRLDEISPDLSYRQYVLPIVQEHTDETYQNYIVSALERQSRALYTQFADAVWVSDYFAIERAKSKPLQLELAAKLGMSVPDTLITSNPQFAEEFVKKHGVCIAKPMSVISPDNGVFHTTIIRSSDAIDYANLNFDPTIFQVLIEPSVELRVNVADDQVFAAEVWCDSEDGSTAIRDYRLGFHDGTFQAAATIIPNKLAEACIQMLRELGVKFGAFDFIVDKKGTIWFLEVNTNGQWAFIESRTGQEISRAIARMLLKGLGLR